MNMKYLAHVPVEHYGFISVETDSAEDAVLEYERIKKLFKDKSGIPALKFNEIVDEYIHTRKIQNGGDIWEDLSFEQKLVINEIKKSFKRTQEQ